MSAELAGQAYVEMSVKGQAEFAKAFAEMQAHIRQFSDKIGQMKGDGATSALRRGISSVTKGFKSLIGHVAKYSAVFAAAFGAGAIAYFTQAISKASDFQETINKFNVVFEDQAGAMSQWGDQFAKQMGRSRTETKKMLADLQGFLRPMGIDPKQAAQMSQSLTQLSYDLASFNNVADEEAFTALMSAISGEAEPMKRFGVIVNDAAMKAELLKRGLNPESATEAQKAMARYNLILQGTALAQGDVERSSDSYANRLKTLQAEWDNLSATIGERVLPYGEALLAWATSVLQDLEGLATGTQGAGEQIELLGISLSDLIGFGNGVVSVFHFIAGAIKGAMGVLATFMAGLTKLAQFAADNVVTRRLFGIDNTAMAGAALGAASDQFLKDAQAYFDGAGASFDAATKETIQSTIDNIRASLDQAKAELEAKRKETKQEADKAKADLGQIADLGPQVLDDKARKKSEKDQIQAQIDALKGTAQEIASPKALEENTVAALERFRENQNNETRAIQAKQLAALEKMKKALEKPNLAIAAIGD